ncbi:hypothetical protein MLD38_032937 [Melastoma candidum]|uniref:Uncharacterized protein n=1 Tax=Melastoma candidum TaxID=119954 RepID=A0ACB9M7P9_9MYRT|nr:hypothetical protein MLD38_032937 [Melastoma candidum]
MAPPSPSIPTPSSKTLHRSSPLSALLSIFVALLLVLSIRPTHGASPSPLDASPTGTSRRLLPDSVAASAFRPQYAKTHHPASRSEYEAGDHEVPSGPNPISNR